MAARLVRAGLWRRLDRHGLERFELARDDEGWTLSGTILVAGPDAVEARYEVRCDTGWRTRRTRATVRDAEGERALEITTADGRWQASGTELAAVRGCVDVDLEWSPSTNTLPIRRLGPRTGEGTGLLTMAWVRFPALTVEPLAQEYRRLSERGYHYSSGGGSFQADIEVDDDALVVRYQGGWERVG